MPTRSLGFWPISSAWTAGFSRHLLLLVLACPLLSAQADLAALKKQARDLVLGEQPAAALEVIGRARASAPRDPELFIWTGEAHFQLEEWEKAVTAFREAIAIDASAAPLIQNLGHALLRLQRPKEAREHFLLVAEKAPKPAARARGLAGVGLALADEGNEKGARARFEEALKVDPGLLRARYRLALIQIKAAEAVAAVENLRKVVAVDPLFEGAAYNLALALRAAKDEAGAKDWEERFKQVRKAKHDLEELKGTLRKNPAAAEVMLAIARVYQSAGSNADAIDWFTRYLATRPDDAAAKAELDELRKKGGG